MDVSQFVIYQEFLGFVCEKSVMKHVASWMDTHAMVYF